MGSTGTPGKNSAASFFIGANTCAVSGGGGELGPRVSNVETTTFGSATNCSSLLRTVSASTPGQMRQLILALARCGSALVACPASSMVATQVVRSVALQLGSLAETSAMAAASFGSLTNARMASATGLLPWAAW